MARVLNAALNMAAPPGEGYQLTSPEYVFLSASDLLRRGWTERMLEDILVLPDTTDKNPHSPFGKPMRLYSAARVQVAESDPDVAKRIERNLARRKKSQPRGELFERVCQAIAVLEIDVPEMSRDELMRQAQKSIQTNPQILMFWREDELRIAAAVEYLWTRCEHYEWLLDDLFGCPGVRALRRLLRGRILSAIAGVYPFLAEECAKRAQSEPGEIHWRRTVQAGI